MPLDGLKWLVKEGKAIQSIQWHVVVGGSVTNLLQQILKKVKSSIQFQFELSLAQLIPSLFWNIKDSEKLKARTGVAASQFSI